MSEPCPVLSVVTRSGEVESFHRGALAVAHEDDVVAAIGDVDRPVFARSAVKPFQALPFLERGLAERFGIEPAEIAVMCASHDGTPHHVELVRSLLARGGLAGDDLGCGPHAPFDPEVRRMMLARGERPTKLHNNCSGKHAGFLLLAQTLGERPQDALDPDGAAQVAVREAVAAMTGAESLGLGLDGCGAPTFRLPLVALARGFARLANPEGLPAVRGEACRTILSAVGDHPVSFAGGRRLCTALVRRWPGRVFAKNGAEGVYAVALAPDPGRTRFPGAVGLAVAIDDGAERGYLPVVIETLRRLGAFGSDEVPETLRRFHRVPVQNTRKEAVGEVRAVFEWMP